MLDDPNLLLLPAKLLVYWLGIYLLMHCLPGLAKKGPEPLRLRTSFWAAGLRFFLGLLLGIPLALVAVHFEEWLVFLLYALMRILLWLLALRAYHRWSPGRTWTLVLSMTALNFLMDRFVLGGWLAPVLANFSMC